MRAPTDHAHEGRHQTVPASPDAPVANSPLEAPHEREASCEEIER